MSTVRRWVVICALAACGGDDGKRPAEEPSSAVDSATSEPSPGLQIVPDATAMPQDFLTDDADVFDLITGDIDLDGDLDVLINHHLRAPIDVLRNDGGTFTLLSRPDDDRSGVWDNPGIPDLYATEDEVLGEAEAPGLYVWHDPDRDDAWQLWWSGGRLRLRLLVSRPPVSITGLPEGVLRRQTEYTASLAFESKEAARFAVSNQLIGTQLRLELDEGVTTFVGATRAALTEPVVSLWKPDPHGMALVDTAGSEDPELFVTRGGLTGLLLPPNDPKTDQLFVAVDEEMVLDVMAARDSIGRSERSLTLVVWRPRVDAPTGGPGGPTPGRANASSLDSESQKALRQEWYFATDLQTRALPEGAPMYEDLTVPMERERLHQSQ